MRTFWDLVIANAEAMIKRRVGPGAAFDRLTTEQIGPLLDVLEVPNLDLAPGDAAAAVLARIAAHLRPGSPDAKGPPVSGVARLAKLAVTQPYMLSFADIKQTLALLDPKADVREQKLVLVYAILREANSVDREDAVRMARAAVDLAKLDPNDPRLPEVIRHESDRVFALGSVYYEDAEFMAANVDLARTAHEVKASPRATILYIGAMGIRASAQLPLAQATEELERAAALFPAVDPKEAPQIWLIHLMSVQQVLAKSLGQPEWMMGDRAEIRRFAARCIELADAELKYEQDDPAAESFRQHAPAFMTETPWALYFDAAWTSALGGGIESYQPAREQLAKWTAAFKNEAKPTWGLFKARLLDALVFGDEAGVKGLFESPLPGPDHSRRDGTNLMTDTMRSVSDRFWPFIQTLTKSFAGGALAPDAEVAAKALALLGDCQSKFAPSDVSECTERCAWGALLAGKPAKAAEWFGAVVNGTIPAPSAGGAPPAARRGVDQLRGLAEAQLAANDLPAAFATFRDIASATDPSKEPGAAHAADYFHAWARMLEILDRQADEKPERIQVIAREVRRLRLLKPADACPECAKRIEQVASRRGVGPAAP